jgi:hypothetical protein
LWQEKDGGKLPTLDQSCAAAILCYRNEVTAQRRYKLKRNLIWITLGLKSGHHARECASYR